MRGNNHWRKRLGVRVGMILSAAFILSVGMFRSIHQRHRVEITTPWLAQVGDIVRDLRLLRSPGLLANLRL